MELFVLNEAGLLDTVRSPAGLASIVELAWHLRQRDVARANALAREAESLLTAATISEAERQSMRARLQLVRAEMKWLFAENAEAETLAQSALQTFVLQDDSVGSFDAHWLLAMVRCDQGDSAGSDAALKAAGRLALQSGDSLRAAMAEVGAAYVAVARDPEAGGQWRAPAAATVVRTHPAVLAWSAAISATRAFGERDFAGAIVYGATAFDAAISSGQSRQGILAAHITGRAFAALNDHRAALEWMFHGLGLARSIGSPANLSLCLVAAATAMRPLGMPEQMQELIVEVFPMLRLTGDAENQSLMQLYLGKLALESRDFPAALNHFSQLARRADALMQASFRFESRCGQAEALSCLSRTEEALAVADAALVLARKQNDSNRLIAALQLLANLHRRHGGIAPDGSGAPNACSHYLALALDVAATLADSTFSCELLGAIAREYAACGDHARAYASMLRQSEARDKIRAAENQESAAARHAHSRIVQARAAADLKRKLSDLADWAGATCRDIFSQVGADAIHAALGCAASALHRDVTIAIFMLDAEGAQLTRAFCRRGGQSLPVLHLPLANAPAHISQCVHARREIWLDADADNGGRWDTGEALDACAALAVPMQGSERVHGVMLAEFHAEPVFSAAEQRMFSLLSSMGAAALENDERSQRLREKLRTLRQTENDLFEVDFQGNQPVRNGSDDGMELVHFLASTSHELRQPMHAMNLYLATLDSIVLPERANFVLKNLRQCARILDDIFLSLLDLACLQAKVMLPRIEQFPIMSLLSRIRLEFLQEVKAKMLDFTVVPSSAWGESDPLLVQKILRNLVANMIHYTESGRILIGCRRRGNQLRLSIYNVASATSAHREDVRAETFSQLWKKGRGRAASVDLGLTVAHRLGQLLSVQIEALPISERGSVVTIDLPLKALHSAVRAPTTASDDIFAEKVVVVVDDDETILDAMRSLLESLRCTVVTAVSGDTVMKELSEATRSPDALICDFRLSPDETGLDVIRALRYEFNEDIPALLITGEAASEHIQKALADGIPVLYKPVQFAVLREALLDLLGP